MPADSLAVFSQHWNMWKKLVFYISQLVASSADWPVTPHRDPNAHKGSVPNELTAFPEREREREGGRGRHSLWEIYVLPHEAKGTRSLQHTRLHTPAHTHSCSQVRRLLGKWTWSVSEITDQKVSCTTPHPRRSLSRPDVCASFAYRSVHFALPLERIMAFRWGDYVKVEGSDWKDNFNLAKNGNPIQRGEEEQIIPCSSVLCQVWGFQTFPSHFMLLCFWCALCGDRFLSARDAGIFLITHLSQNQDKYMETSCHCDNVHTAVLDSETGSLYSWGLKLINPRRKITVHGEVSITEQNLTSQSKIITLTSFDQKIWRLL